MNEPFRRRFEYWRLEELLIKYPGLRILPSTNESIKVGGAIVFSAEGPDRERVNDEYQVEISIPARFPKWPPSVKETGGRVPTTFHKLDDGCLCLGSQTRLLLILSESPSVVSFVERCVIPYLYGYSYFEKHHVMLFGELDHGRKGLRQDLMSIYGIVREDELPGFVRLTSKRKRQANKQPCPCGSNRRLGRCHNLLVNRLRGRLGRYWFASLYATLFSDSRGTPQIVQ